MEAILKAFYPMPQSQYDQRVLCTFAIYHDEMDVFVASISYATSVIVKCGIENNDV